ncbi:MAG: winged helix-turn-helix domain-containing protein [Myxococcota bacterium]
MTEMEHRLVSYLAQRASPAPVDELLREVWGYHERVRSRSPYVIIQRLRKKIELEPSSPRHLLCIQGQGYVLRPKGGPTVELPPPSPLAEDLVGRAESLRSLHQAVEAGCRWLTIHAGAGVGKTRLALEFLATRPSMSVDRDVLLRLGPHDSHATTLASLHAVYAATGSDASGANVLLKTIAERGRHVLVIDGAEGLHATLAPRLDRIVESTRDVTLLVTSRVVLRGIHETRFTLPPLDRASAGRLLRSRGRRCGWETRDEPATTARLERLAHGNLEGNPLAIELAASRLPVLGLSGLAEALKDRFRVLRTQAPSYRFNSLQASLEWSWKLLDEGERTFLKQIALLNSPFTVAEVEALPFDHETWTIDMLQAMVNHSFVQPDQSADPPKFRMLDSAREFVSQREEAAARRGLDPEPSGND